MKRLKKTQYHINLAFQSSLPSLNLIFEKRQAGISFLEKIIGNNREKAERVLKEGHLLTGIDSRQAAILAYGLEKEHEEYLQRQKQIRTYEQKIEDLKTYIDPNNPRDPNSIKINTLTRRLLDLNNKTPALLKSILEENLVMGACCFVEKVKVPLKHMNDYRETNGTGKRQYSPKQERDDFGRKIPKTQEDTIKSQPYNRAYQKMVFRQHLLNQ